MTRSLASKTLPSPWIESPLVRRAASALGWLCVLTTLALTGPGVVATAKGEPAVNASGPTCEVSQRSSETTAVELARMIERLRSDAAAQVDPSEDVVVLDNSGFNYRPQPPAPAEQR